MKTIIEKYLSEKNLKEIAEKAGIKYSSLMRKLNPDDHYKLNVDEIVPLIEATGNFDLIHYLNSELNLISIPMIENDDEFNVEGVAKFMKEGGEAFAEIGRSMADNIMDVDEAIKCRKEALEAAQAAHEFVRQMDKIINPS